MTKKLSFTERYLSLSILFSFCLFHYLFLFFITRIVKLVWLCGISLFFNLPSAKSHIQPQIWSIWLCRKITISDKCLLCKLTITQDIWAISDNLGSIRALVPKGNMLTELFQVLIHLHQQRERKISLPPPYEPPPSYIQVFDRPLFCF